MKIALYCCTHDDLQYIDDTLVTLCSAATNTASKPVSTYAFVSRIPWHGVPGDWQSAAAVANSLDAEVVLGDWPTEQAQRQAAIDHLRGLGYTHALIPDGDEIIEPALLQTLLTIAEHDLADRVYVHWDTYWKTPSTSSAPASDSRPAT